MSRPVTLDDIFQLFERQKEETERYAAETDRYAAETDRRAAEAKVESDRRAAEAERLAAEAKVESDRRAAEAKAESDRRAAEAKAESDRRAAEAKAESDRRAAEWERNFAASKAESDRRAAEAQAEWERNFAASKAENDRRIAELDRVVTATTEAVNNLTGRWGRFVEELVKPAVVEMFREKGVEIDHSFLRAEAPDRSMEIDILGVNTTDVVLVECKSRLTQEDVNYFLGKLPRFKSVFREFSTYKVYGAVAGIEIDQGVDRYAYKRGLFVIKPSGNTVMIVNDNNFRPQTW